MTKEKDVEKFLEQLSEEELEQIDKGEYVGNVCDDCIDEKRKKVKHDYKAGDYVKCEFESSDDRNEYMWVLIEEIDETTITGRLDNDPVLVHQIKCGDTVKINKDKIVQVIYM